MLGMTLAAGRPLSATGVNPHGPEIRVTALFALPLWAATELKQMQLLLMGLIAGFLLVVLGLPLLLFLVLFFLPQTLFIN